MATLREVAERAGVHPSTVSLILNGSDGNGRFSESTRENVQRVAVELGYVRNQSASTLRRGRSNLVGFLGGDIRNPFFAELITELEQALRREGRQLLLSGFTYSAADSIEEHLGVLLSHSIEAVVFWDEAQLTPRVRERVGELASVIPVGFHRGRRTGIWLDLEKGIELGVDYLVRCGCRRLCFFGPDPSGERSSPSLALRADFFETACRRRGLEGEVVCYRGQSWQIEAAAEGATALLERLGNDSRAGVLAFNDVAALGLCMRCSRDGGWPAFPLFSFDGTAQIRAMGEVVGSLDLRLDRLAAAVVRAVCQEGRLPRRLLAPRQRGVAPGRE